MKTAMPRKWWDEKRNNMGGHVVDSEFDWYSFDLISDKTGQTYAWGFKNDYGYWHIGESDTKTTQHDCPLYDSMQNANGDSQSDIGNSKYEIRFFDKSGKPQYVLPFTPAYAYRFDDEHWKLINSTSHKEFKNSPAAKKSMINALKKWLKKAVDATIDDMITKSNFLPVAGDDEEHPLHALDKNFGDYAYYEIYRNGEEFCWAEKMDEYLCFSFD